MSKKQDGVTIKGIFVPRMKKRIKKKWLKALRSGEYIQGEGQLCVPPEMPDPSNEHGNKVPDPDGDYSFCCLGVLTNLYYLEKGEEFPESEWDDGGLPLDVQEWSGLHTDIPLSEEGYEDYNPIIDKLIAMNDGEETKSGKTFPRRFPTIAKYIEKNL